jgi:hypothetical protein
MSNGKGEGFSRINHSAKAGLKENPVPLAKASGN